MSKIKLWWLRTFCVITTEKAKSLGLSPKYNIYGDYINKLNCRSIWKDNKDKEYRVHELVEHLF